MYEISTIGDLKTSPPSPPSRTDAVETVSAPLIAVVAIGGLLVGARGLWAWSKYA